MQFTVIGAGNMGCIYGGNLARIGERVAMLDVWEDHVKRIQNHGLEIDGLHGTFVAPVTAFNDAAAAQKSDIVLICVNAYSAREAANSARILLKDSGFVVTLQNGLGNVEILAEVLGADRVMAGLSFHSADLRGPGQVTHTNSGPTYLGELDKSRSSRLSVLCGLLDSAGMNPVLVDDIMATVWGKFVHNCGLNAVCAITGLLPAQIQRIPALDEFQTRIIEEVLALVKAKGITIPDPNPIESIKAYCAKKHHRVSMLQHLERGRQTEIDALNGYVARESARLGLAAPYNDALTSLVKGRQHRSAD